jgi:hypothetical protein
MSDPASTNGHHTPEPAPSVPPTAGGNGEAIQPLDNLAVSATNGRDRRGRFAPGNPGRPPRHRNGQPSTKGEIPKITVETTVPATAPDAGRNAQGRFVKGYRGGPGNPYARRVAALRTAILDTVSEADMRGIALRLRLQAQAGDLASIKLLLLYALGKPSEQADPDTLDVQEWQTYQHRLIRPEDVTALMQRLPPELVVGLVRILLPCLGHAFRQQFLHHLGSGEVDEAAGDSESQTAGD